MSKRTLLTMLTLMLMVFSVQTVFAKEQTVAEFDIVAAKKALVEKHKQEFDPTLTGEKQKKHNQDIELLLNQLASGDGDQVEINEKLKKKKVYKLELPQDQIITPMSQPSDVSMNAVSIYADAGTGNWYVTGGGSWPGNAWTGDAPTWGLYPSVGATKNVGGYDSVGITYYNTGGTYGTTVLSSQGYWHDGVGNSWSSYSPSHGDGKLGAAFDFQDKVRVTNVNWDGSYNYAYQGKGFAATITYTPNFVHYNGKARTFYAHTWDQAVIDSITFGAATGSFGVDIQISNTAQGFKAFNNSDTNF